MQIACFSTWQPAPVTFCPPPLCVPFDFILARLFCVCVQALYQLHYPPSHASDRLIAGPLIHPSAVIHCLPSVNKWPLHNCSPPRQSAWSIPEVEPARSTNRPSAHFSGDCLTSFPEEDSEGVGRLQKVRVSSHAARVCWYGKLSAKQNNKLAQIHQSGRQDCWTQATPTLGPKFPGNNRESNPDLSWSCSLPPPPLCCRLRLKKAFKKSIVSCIGRDYF